MQINLLRILYKTQLTKLSLKLAELRKYMLPYAIP